jgi:hypothetical protein
MAAHWEYPPTVLSRYISAPRVANANMGKAIRLHLFDIPRKIVGIEVCRYFHFGGSSLDLVIVIDEDKPDKILHDGDNIGSAHSKSSKEVHAIGCRTHPDPGGPFHQG